MEQWLFIGDKRKAVYHPMGQIPELIEAYMEGQISIKVIESDQVMGEELSLYEGVIFYGDVWEGTISDEEAEQFKSYMRTGGKALMIHSGISIARNNQVYSLIGARFNKHPDMCDLGFLYDKHHPLCKDLRNFILKEEPYQFIFDKAVNRDVFLRYSYEDHLYDAGWVTSIGDGTIVYIHPGHELGVFKHSDVKRLIQSCIGFLREL